MLLAAVQYAAPEYFLGEPGGRQSDVFSLGDIAYQMLSGRLPYGARVPQARTRAAQRRLTYASLLDDGREIPAWVDEALKKAVHPDPGRRTAELSELVHDLRHPSEDFARATRPPLLERNPAMFWKGVSFLLAVVIVILMWRR